MGTAIHPGAQTERRGGAGPVRGLLGGKDLTGCFIREPGIRGQKKTAPRFLTLPCRPLSGPLAVVSATRPVCHILLGQVAHWSGGATTCPDVPFVVNLDQCATVPTHHPWHPPLRGAHRCAPRRGGGAGGLNPATNRAVIREAIRAKFSSGL